ncbi:PREDICTED: protein LITTLE ZIPPER 2-like [Camelina sativa]|uniref:Protein LITTLE ZIPPER 2-like n=1 Tax=Camelina sativa TaxID=90675 RepID=A0ABM0WCK0_CAMSA|nr:PREDICTED: protein LITTLE ZIPPER 2-like [Camelina sativa]
MCLKSSKPPFPDTQTLTMRSASHHNRRKSKKQIHIRVLNLTRRRRLLREANKEMEMRNLKLLVENQSIIQKNEALKKKALLLHQENNALFALLHPTLSPVSTSFLLRSS